MTALVTKRTAKVAAKPAMVRTAFKARMTDTHVFNAARCTQRTEDAVSTFPMLLLMLWIT